MVSLLSGRAREATGVGGMAGYGRAAAMKSKFARDANGKGFQRLFLILEVEETIKKMSIAENCVVLRTHRRSVDDEDFLREIVADVQH